MSTATVVPNPQEAGSFTDAKRYLWPLGIIIPLLPVMSYVWVEMTGWGGMWWWGFFFLYAVIPAMDYLFGDDTINPPEAAVKTLENDSYYRWLTYLFIPAQYATLLWGTWYVATHEMLWWEMLGFSLSIGIVGGLAINTAHELGHKRPALERWLSRITLAQTFYGHFYVEHNRGHHKNVATPEDPASSRMG